jgi:hypothetical protein
MNRTKLLLFVVTILILASTIFSYVFLEKNFLIRKWNIPIDPPGFRDAQQIGIASESYAHGYDPLKENLYTSEGYQGLNYPRIWHVLFFIGINQSHTNLIGSIFTLLFFAGIAAFWFAREYDNFTYVILFVLFLSPPVMLGIERGNIEVVVFFVLAVALLINNYSTMSGFILFLFAAFLKLHPVFSFVVFMREQKKKFWGLFISACVIFISYVLFTLDLKQMYLIQPMLAKSSFGLNVFWMGLAHPHLLNLQISDDVIMSFKVLSYIVLALIFMGAFILSVRNYNTGKHDQGEHLDAFRVGAAIYIGCFLMGNNFDYRLIFLIFTVPQLAAWLSKKDNGLSLVPHITLLAMVFSFWSFFITRFLGQKLTFILEEFSNWVILAGLLYLFLVSVPGWFNDYLRRPLSKIMNFDSETIANR